VEEHAVGSSRQSPRSARSPPCSSSPDTGDASGSKRVDFNVTALLAATPKRSSFSTKRTLPGCLIGTPRAGRTVHLTVFVTPRFTGRRPNRAVVNTSTAEIARRDDVSRAFIFVRPRPRFTG
jgi:hypothetical protein